MLQHFSCGEIWHFKILKCAFLLLSYLWMKGRYTAVHTVLTVNSVSPAMMSVGWMLRSYMGFSNVARPFVFSWPT